MKIHSSILAWESPWTRSLVGYSPWGRKESDTTEPLNKEQVELSQLTTSLFASLGKIPGKKSLHSLS